MASPPALCNYRAAPLGSEVHITSAVISMCVWEQARTCESKCTSRSSGLMEHTERACGWPAPLNVHFGGLIIRDNVCLRTAHPVCVRSCVCVCSTGSGKSPLKSKFEALVYLCFYLALGFSMTLWREVLKTERKKKEHFGDRISSEWKMFCCYLIW